jgi:hypothetical protein
MSRSQKILLTFIVSFVLGYLLFGYFLNAMIIRYDWLDKSNPLLHVSEWQKLRVYYIETWFLNVIPAALFTAIPVTVAAYLTSKKRRALNP